MYNVYANSKGSNEFASEQSLLTDAISIKTFEKKVIVPGLEENSCCAS